MHVHIIVIAVSTCATAGVSNIMNHVPHYSRRRTSTQPAALPKLACMRPSTVPHLQRLESLLSLIASPGVNEHWAHGDAVHATALSCQVRTNISLECTEMSEDVLVLFRHLTGEK